MGDIETGKGLNQEMGLGRPGDTRWGSHYKTVMHLVALYPSIRKVLIMVGNDHSQKTECSQAQTMLTIFNSYEFVFMAHYANNTRVHGGLESRYCQCSRTHFFDQDANVRLAGGCWVGGFP